MMPNMLMCIIDSTAVPPCHLSQGCHGVQQKKAQAGLETVVLQESVSGAKKKRHSTMGHMWKVVRKGMQLPKQAAAELQAISVSAAKQAGDVMTVVRDKVQEDVQAMQDHLLGGKRNLPDHPGELCAPAPCLLLECNLAAMSHACLYS